MTGRKSGSSLFANSSAGPSRCAGSFSDAKKPGDLPGFKGVKSPSEFFDLSANHSRKQFETLTEQAKEFVVQQRNAVRAAGYNL